MYSDVGMKPKWEKETVYYVETIEEDIQESKGRSRVKEGFKRVKGMNWKLHMMKNPRRLWRMVRKLGMTGPGGKERSGIGKVYHEAGAYSKAGVRSC